MRKSLLNVYLENITFRFPEWKKMDMDKLISICMETYKSFPLKEHDKISLQKQLIEQNKSLIIPVYADILDSLVPASEKVNIISIGSGGSGDIEKDLDTQLRKRKKKINRWIGIDPYASRTEDSFFTSENFFTPKITNTSSYVDIVGADNNMSAIIMANYSLHHMQQNLEAFLKRCAGSMAVILLEEPIAEEDWADPALRLERIAYDILANTAINPKWADKFLVNQSLFHVQYITLSDIKKSQLTLFPIQDVYPETAILVWTPRMVRPILSEKCDKTEENTKITSLN